MGSVVYKEVEEDVHLISRLTGRRQRCQGFCKGLTSGICEEYGYDAWVPYHFVQVNHGKTWLTRVRPKYPATALSSRGHVV